MLLFCIYSLYLFVFHILSSGTLIGDPSCYSYGTWANYLDYCSMQKVERLVALGNT